MGFFNWLDRKLRKFYVGEIYEDRPEVRMMTDLGIIANDKSLTEEQRKRAIKIRLDIG